MAKFGECYVHIIPRYLNCTDWARDFDKLQSCLLNLESSSFCVLGDLNARMANCQVIDENLLTDLPLVSTHRNSKDKIIDAKGKKLLDLMENCGGVLVNGRMNDDVDGEFTFCGVMGSSIIDYCFCSLDVLKFMSKFTIPRKSYSDHFPITISISSSTDLHCKTVCLPGKIPWLQKNLSRYQTSLSSLASCCYITGSLSVDEKLNLCVNKIKGSSEASVSKKNFDPKNKWFDWECENFRKKMLKKLDRYRETSSSLDRIAYVNCKSEYLKLRTKKELQYKENNINKLNIVRNSSDWWKLAKSLKTNDLKIGSNVQVCQFFHYFSNLLSDSCLDSSIYWCLPCVVDPFLDSPFEMIELQSVLQRAKNNKAPGYDRISYEFYKNAPFCFLKEILKLFNLIFIREEIPESFRKSIIVPIFKKGDVNVVSNYRGLSLLDSIYKLFTGILLDRINDWIFHNNILNEFQAGFRKGYSTVDSLFNLVSIVNINFNQNKKTFAFFVDFTAAFDMIPRNSLFYKLSMLGMSQKMVSFLQLLYNNTKSCIWDGCSLSSYFDVKQGVKQGCLLSPVLFSLYLNDLHDFLPGGINISGCIIKVLLYADDIVIISDCPHTLQNMINALYNYCNLWCLKLNLNKSKIVVFRKSPRLSSNLKWNFGTENIEIVNDYKYLGILLNYKLSFTKHLEEKLSASKLAINTTWLSYIHHPKISISNKLKIFHAAAKSIMFYGAPIWGYLKFDVVEKLLRYFLKKILLLPQNTPNYMLYLETGIHSLYLDTLDLHLNYIKRVLNLPINRLPRLLAKEAVQLNTFWFPHWKNISRNPNLNFDHLNNLLENLHCSMLEIVRSTEYNDNILLARQSQHDLYKVLNYSVDYFNCYNSAYYVGVIFKIRGALFKFNACSIFGTSNGLCSICNLNEIEDTYHVIGKCPLFSSFRIECFGKRTLSLDHVINILNATNFSVLLKFLKLALNYRNLILNEFN